MKKAGFFCRIFWLVVLLSISVCDGQQLVANYVRYDGYSASDQVVDAGTSQFVPMLADCLALSTASPLTNGIMFNAASHLCVVLTANWNKILVNLQSNVDWTVFLKDISDQSRVLFKLQANIGGAATPVSAVFSGTTASYVTSNFTAAVASLDVSTACNCWYRSPFIDHWNVSQVQVDYVKQGMVVARMVFNGVGSSATNWFDQNNLVATWPYSLSVIRTTSFRIFGSTLCGICSNNNLCRNFLMFTGGPGNCQDYYYTAVTNEACCGYSASPYLNLIYSATATDNNGFAQASLRADFFVISAKVVYRATGLN